MTMQEMEQTVQRVKTPNTANWAAGVARLGGRLPTEQEWRARMDTALVADILRDLLIVSDKLEDERVQGFRRLGRRLKPSPQGPGMTDVWRRIKQPYSDEIIRRLNKDSPWLRPRDPGDPRPPRIRRSNPRPDVPHVAGVEWMAKTSTWRVSRKNRERKVETVGEFANYDDAKAAKVADLAARKAARTKVS